MHRASELSSPLRHVSSLSLSIWGVAIAYVIYQFILRVSLGIMAPSLMERFAINATEFSLLGSIFYFGYASMQIPVGIFLDYFGPLKTIPLFLFLCVTGFCLFTFSDNWSLVLFGRLLTGIGSAGAFISSLKVSSLLFPERLSRTFIGITSGLGLLGAVCGGLIGFLFSIFSLQTLLQVLSFSGIGLLLLVGISFSFQTTQALLNIREEATHPSEEKLIPNMLKIFRKQPSLLLWMVSIGLMTMSLYTFADSWGPSFLMHVHHASMDEASTAIFLVYMGMVTGASCLSFIGNYFNKTNLLIILCGLLITGILIILLSFPHLPYWVLLLLMFLFGVCSSLQILFFGVILSLVPRKFGGVTSGLTNMVIMLLGSGSISLMGLLMDYTQGPKTHLKHVPVYGRAAYTFAFGLITGLVFLGVLIFSSIILKNHLKTKNNAS